MPTLAQLCNLKNTPDDIDGLDLSFMIQNPETTSPRTSAFWKYGNQWVVRKGKWKLIGYPKDTSHKGILDIEKDALFLSDLSTDVSEMDNLAKQHPEIVEELIADFIAWEHGSENDIPKKQKEINHLGRKGRIIATKKLHPKYKNIAVLLDGKTGYSDYSSGQWIGQEGDDLEFIIDLKNAKNISQVELNYLSSTQNWIFPPASFEVRFSNDGKTFSNSKKMEISLQKNENYIDASTIKVNRNSRYVKIIVKGIGNCPANYPGAGNPAWFFIDEISIK
jgi:hypothetical protein